MAQEKHCRFEKNVPGPFYTNGECLACEVPESEAPDLLAPLDDGNGDTHFVRQPTTDAEIERACRALESCCVAALRYGGTDPKIIRRLGNHPDYCDHVLLGGPVSPPDWMATWWEYRVLPRQNNDDKHLFDVVGARVKLTVGRSGTPRSEEFLKRVWTEREEQIYPEFFGDLGAGIFPLQTYTFEDDFQQTPDPRWLFTGVLECPPSSKHDDWIYVSSGLSNPWKQDAPVRSPDELSWLGLEFLLRVTQQGNWAINLVHKIAAFKILLAHNRYEGRERLGYADRVPLRGPIVPGTESALTYLLLAPPLSFPESFQLESGRVELVQLVGISEREAAFGRENGLEPLLELLNEHDAYLTTNPFRSSIV